MDRMTIQIDEGQSEVFRYEDLTISTNLCVYDEKSAPHLIGDVSLGLKDNDSLIASFYINGDKSGEEYYTRIYKKHFLTFEANDTLKNLIIEKAKLGKAFALQDKGSFVLGDDDELELEITNSVHEWGYDEPPIGNEDGAYFDDVNYTLKVKTKDLEKEFSFYSSELKTDYSIDVGAYTIRVLSDKYHDSYCLIEMILNKRE